MKKSEVLLYLGKNKHPLYLVDGKEIYCNVENITFESPMPYWLLNNKAIKYLTNQQAILAVNRYINGSSYLTRYKFFWGEKEIKL